MKNRNLIFLKIFSIIFCNVVQYLQGGTNGYTGLYTVKIKSIKCFDIDTEHILNVTCNVKNERHKHGLLNICYEERNMDHYMVHLRLFYQNSAGRFLPYLVDFQYDICDFSQMLTGSPLSKIVYFMGTHGTSSEVKASRQKCPYNVSSL